MCQNPFFKCEGKSSHIAVIIRLNGVDHEVCDSCWQKIADSDIEWGEPLPEPYFGPFPQQQPNVRASVKRVEPKLRRLRVL
jgi:hypothetical protein